MRRCDLCDDVKPIVTKWWFITEGKRDPSDWQVAKHWCEACMTFLKQQHMA